MILDLFRFSRLEMVKVLVLLMLGGFLEGVSVLTLLPVVTLVTRNSGAPQS